MNNIMNTVEKTSTGVTPAELVLTNSIRLTSRILAPPSASNNRNQISDGQMEPETRNTFEGGPKEPVGNRFTSPRGA